MWQRTPEGDERIDQVTPGISIDIPVGTAFQFRTSETSRSAPSE
jgi:mannose-6-phosphate isomerase-like protein (cupin superfamily)